MRFAYALIVLLAVAAPLAASEISGTVQVVDADTVHATDVKIRLSGVDAPETDQICLDRAGRPWNCGVEARRRLEAFSDTRTWTCRLRDVDAYGRHIGVCIIGGEDVSRWLVRNGWALAFRRYSTTYIADEDFARSQGNGLWSGAFIAPWDWRRRDQTTEILGAYAVPTDAQRRLIAPAAAGVPPTAECVIKGNLRSDACVYHVPGGQFYGRLDMQQSSNRRWFCSEAEAQAAGCRKSKR